MVDYEYNRGPRTAPTLSDMRNRVESLKDELPYEIKQFKKEISDFLSMDKKLSSLRNKAEKKQQGGRAEAKADAYASEYNNAYKRCRATQRELGAHISEVSVLYSKITDSYSAAGNRREAKATRKEGAKFEKTYKKLYNDAVDVLNSASQIKEANLGESDRRGTYNASGRNLGFDESAMKNGDYASEKNQYRQRPQYTQYPPYYPPVYQQPLPSFNIAPISIDVNSAVDSAMESFVKLFEERVEEYLDGYELPAGVKGSASQNSTEELEKASYALDSIAEEESFALDKIVELMERVKALISGIADLTASYAGIEEKQKAAVEASKNINDMHRAIAREIQGVQATQKVISGDQLKLAEEQAVILEEQKTAGLEQAAVSEAQKALSGELLSASNAEGAISEALKLVITSQQALNTEAEAITNTANKLLELQKTLGERQGELTELQREALLAHKKLARSQKAVNERVGAKKKSAAKEETEKTLNSENEGLSVEANESAEETVQPIVSEAEETALNTAPSEEAVSGEISSAEIASSEAAAVVAEAENTDGLVIEESSHETNTAEQELSEAPAENEDLAVNSEPLVNESPLETTEEISEPEKDANSEAATFTETISEEIDLDKLDMTEELVGK